jgi:hypothetical protein
VGINEIRQHRFVRGKQLGVGQRSALGQIGEVASKRAAAG